VSHLVTSDEGTLQYATTSPGIGRFSRNWTFLAREKRVTSPHFHYILSVVAASSSFSCRHMLPRRRSVVHQHQSRRREAKPRFVGAGARPASRYPLAFMVCQFDELFFLIIGHSTTTSLRRKSMWPFTWL
jgi:hypothetical protein